MEVLEPGIYEARVLELRPSTTSGHQRGSLKIIAVPPSPAPVPDVPQVIDAEAAAILSASDTEQPDSDSGTRFNQAHT